jgi:hypothetical protein
MVVGLPPEIQALERALLDLAEEPADIAELGLA